ncbi:MAG TPA: FixH family protein [Bacteroidia bacterium]|nr:FixH family protein [Bacteroidia bacterium]HNS13335.1 FixH family protein [Bacteroidia bacterium]
MKTRFLLYILVILSAVLTISSCKKDDENTPSPASQNPTTGLTLLSEAYAIGAGTKVEVWARSAYVTGYNDLYLYLKDSVTGAVVQDADITLLPMMDMGMMMHSAPCEHPSSHHSQDGLYHCSVVFLMSSMGGTWTLDATIHNHANGKTGIASMTVNVAEAAVSRLKSFISSTGGETLFVSLVEPKNPVVGINNLEVVVHKRMNMGMEFPADSSMTIEISPLMVSMGHGSPNNVNPTHVGMGHYKGAVNYTMSGDWNINFTFKSGGMVANNTLYFETLVP